jgi:hypothetical protein
MGRRQGRFPGLILGQKAGAGPGKDLEGIRMADRGSTEFKVTDLARLLRTQNQAAFRCS